MCQQVLAERTARVRVTVTLTSVLDTDVSYKSFPNRACLPLTLLISIDPKGNVMGPGNQDFLLAFMI